MISLFILAQWWMSCGGDSATSCFYKFNCHRLFLLSPTRSLPLPVPEAIDAYINASKTVLKQGEALTVNCTVHGVELVFFSWDIPNREVSRSGALNTLLFSFPFVITLRPHDRAQIASRCGDTPQFLSSCEVLLITLCWFFLGWEVPAK